MLQMIRKIIMQNYEPFKADYYSLFKFGKWQMWNSVFQQKLVKCSFSLHQTLHKKLYYVLSQSVIITSNEYKTDY